jgi:methylmalonyl-CoA/ethylmalonyl-CoA epimerase
VESQWRTNLAKIDHIGIAVNDFVDLTNLIRLLGIYSPQAEEIAEQKVRVLSFPIGDIEIELLQPTDDNSPIAKFLNAKGSGIHHIAFQVENLEAKLTELKALGIRLIDEKPRFGARGKKIAFIHPKSTGGILIELTQITKK